MSHVYLLHKWLQTELYLMLKWLRIGLYPARGSQVATSLWHNQHGVSHKAKRHKGIT